MSREWLEEVSHYRESHGLFRIVTLRQVQTGQFPLLLIICYVPQLALSPGHIISVSLVIVSSVLSLPYEQDTSP